MGRATPQAKLQRLMVPNIAVRQYREEKLRLYRSTSSTATIQRVEAEAIQINGAAGRGSIVTTERGEAEATDSTR